MDRVPGEPAAKGAAADSFQGVHAAAPVVAAGGVREPAAGSAELWAGTRATHG